jgi:3-hydroxyisobutyrate dehydrogenase-like beta-hydroxyacid dehydrogenase
MSKGKERVGLIGLGAVGGHYRDHLLGSYGELVVFDLDAEAMRSAEAAGARPADDLGRLARLCDVVVVSLPHPLAVREALGAPGGLLAEVAPGTVILDTSTVSPEVNREMHDLASLRGAHYLDAPVSGGEPLEGGDDGARAGSMTFMVGGSEEGYELAKPVMSVLGAHWYHLGASGSGTVVKLISNLCSGAYMQVFSEALALGEACGFGLDRLLEVFEHTDAKCFMLTDYVQPRIRRGDVSPGFAVDLQLKDHRLAADLAESVGVDLPMNAAAIALWEAMQSDGRGGRDIADSVSFAAGSGGNAEPGPG